MKTSTALKRFTYKKGETAMIAYAIAYNIRGKDEIHDILIDAKDLKYAKKKIAKRHKFKNSRRIQIRQCSIVGYL